VLIKLCGCAFEKILRLGHEGVDPKIALVAVQEEKETD
jgi:hypothetical protein